MRLVLAFSCFFRMLFTGKLPAEAAPYLPKGLPEPTPKAEVKVVEKVVEKIVEKIVERKPNLAAQHKDGALAFLGLLQREGRLVDFLRESLDTFTDADIGAAARDVHRGCRKVLDQYLSIEAVMPGAEEDTVTVPKGFDPAEVRLIGEAKGDAPFKGTLRHHGWRVVDAKLPSLAEGVDRQVIAPAEVELAP